MCAWLMRCRSLGRLRLCLPVCRWSGCSAGDADPDLRALRTGKCSSFDLLLTSMKRLLRVVAVVLAGWGWAAGAETLVVNDFGAKGDGVAVDTAAIQRALDKGAGKKATVTFKPG